MCRTLFVNPTPDQKKHYEIALAIMEKARGSLTAGATLANVFEKVEKCAKENHVAQYLYPTLGFGIGESVEEPAENDRILVFFSLLMSP